MTIKPKLAQLLAEFLIRRGWTNKDFMCFWNKRYRGYRISDVTVGDWRKGTSQRPKHFSRLCAVLGVDAVKQMEVENDVDCK